MSKRVFVTVALVLVPVVCATTELQPYVGGSIGDEVEFEVVYDVRATSSDSSFKLFGGLKIGEYIAAEIAHHDFGTTKCCAEQYADLGFEREGDAWSAAALALWPINRFRLFGKAGALWWDVKGHDLTIGGPMPYSNDGVDLFVGAGVDFAIVSGLHVRLEWEHFELDETGTDAVSLGALWCF